MVSVIIPCFNCERLIERCVNSVLNQTLKDYEIILVDNNSTDGTLKKLNKFQVQYPGFIKTFFENEIGAPAARNKGLYEATGDYIQFLDADDELKPNKLMSQLNNATHNKADIVAGSSLLTYVINGNRKEYVKRPDSDIWRGLICSNLGITSANLWKRSTVLKAGCWDTNLTSSQEYDLLFRLLKIGAKITFEFSVDTIIHKSDSTVSKSDDKKKLELIIGNRINLRKSITAYLKQMQMLTPALNYAADTYIYNELKSNYGKIPEFAGSYLKMNKLKVSRAFLFKSRIKGFVKSLSGGL